MKCIFYQQMVKRKVVYHLQSFTLQKHTVQEQRFLVLIFSCLIVSFVVRNDIFII